MSKQPGFQIGPERFVFKTPTEGEILLIRVNAWNSVKQKVNEIRERVNAHSMLASAFLGGSISTIGLVVFNAVPRIDSDGKVSLAYVLAWAVGLGLLVSGFGFWYLGWRHQKVQAWQAEQVIAFMTLIEEQCQRAVPPPLAPPSPEFAPTQSVPTQSSAEPTQPDDTLPRCAAQR